MTQTGTEKKKKMYWLPKHSIGGCNNSYRSRRHNPEDNRRNIRRNNFIYQRNFHLPLYYYVLVKLHNCVEQELEGSSLHSQQLATDPYPEPVESNPLSPVNLPKIHSHPILSSDN
jgi:hypothetical protein